MDDGRAIQHHSPSLRFLVAVEVAVAISGVALTVVDDVVAVGGADGVLPLPLKKLFPRGFPS